MAFQGLVERGADSKDILIITKRSYKDPAFDPDENRLGVAIPIRLDAESSAVAPVRKDPFGDTEGEVWLTDRMRYPGDLASGLKELGFHLGIAYGIENSILEGASILIVRTPTGHIDANQATNIIDRYQGKILAPHATNHYVS